MVMANIFTKMVQFIMEIGQMIHNMEQDMKFGMILRLIMEIIIMEKKMELGHIYGKINLCIKENGKIILWKVLEFIIL